VLELSLHDGGTRGAAVTKLVPAGGDPTFWLIAAFLAIHAGRAGTVSPGEIFIVLIYVTLMHNKMVSFGRMIVRIGRVVTSAERLAGVTVSKKRREARADRRRGAVSVPR
jgi:hypothetical protein